MKTSTSKSAKSGQKQRKTLQKAYLYLGNAYTGISDYKNTIECCHKARGISPCFKGDDMEAEANQWLGDNHYQAGQYQKSIAYYKQALELASQCGDIKRKIKAHFGLGNAFSHTGDLESSREYFLKAVTATQQINDKGLRKEAYANLRYAYYKSSMLEAAIKSYREVQNIAHALLLGDIFQELKKYEKAIESYQNTRNISKNFEDEKMQLVVTRRLGLLCLTLASDYPEDHDYDKSIEWYQKALEISEAEPTDQVLREKALRLGLISEIMLKRLINSCSTRGFYKERRRRSKSSQFINTFITYLCFIREITGGHENDIVTDIVSSCPAVKTKMASD